MNKFIVICALNKLAPTRKIAVPYGRQKIVASIEPKLLLLLLRHPGIECPSFSIYRLAKRSDGDLLELVLFQVLEKKNNSITCLWSLLRSPSFVVSRLMQ